MIAVQVTIPFACFRKGLAREFLETEPIPPPSTCYGFLLSLVGEQQRSKHIGARVAPALMAKPEKSTVLRTVWRVKKTPLGSPGNTRPDYQQLLSNVQLLIWMDSSEEIETNDTLEMRVKSAMQNPTATDRFGGLSLGESTHLVNDICLFEAEKHVLSDASKCSIFLHRAKGKLSLPVWVDHVGTSGTNFVTGDLIETSLATAPEVNEMPQISPRS